MQSTRKAVAAIALIATLAACSGGVDPEAGEVTTTVAQPTTTGTAPSTPPTTAPSDGPATAPSLVELRGDLGIDVLVLEPTTEAGGHPTLSWQPAEGAASYWLVLRDGGGQPYWAWTGTDTSVRVGGGDRSDANQTAVLHEAMTWRVAAFDTEGNLIALSDTASLSP